jgi:hypothetical protein
LLGWLAGQARVGATLTLGNLFKAADLSTVNLDEREALLARCILVVSSALSRTGYDPVLDVRFLQANVIRDGLFGAKKRSYVKLASMTSSVSA